MEGGKAKESSPSQNGGGKHVVGTRVKVKEDGREGVIEGFSDGKYMITSASKLDIC